MKNYNDFSLLVFFILKATLNEHAILHVERYLIWTWRTVYFTLLKLHLRKNFAVYVKFWHLNKLLLLLLYIL